MEDVSGLLNEISGALDALGNQALSIVGDDRQFSEIWGWNMPAINRQQFADYLKSPVSYIQKMSEKSIESEEVNLLRQYPSRIAFFQGNTLPNLPGGNAFHVYLTARSLIDSLIDIIRPYTVEGGDWKILTERKLLPASQIKRLHQIDGAITRLTSETDDFESKMRLINDTHAAAEALPADMQSLVEAREEYEAASSRITETQRQASAAKDTAENHLKAIQAFEAEAAQLVKNTAAAYSAATTQGLGKAFGDKANSLTRSIWGLGLLLAVTLGAGAWISSERIDFIHDLMLKPNISMQLLWVNVTLAIISVAGPIWFAWVLTKQIGQRFRLAEDYAFKASVAKAYEGYRLEAVRVNPDLELRLFTSILDRIDEAPLRHVESENHGSPWHELFSWRPSRKKLGNESSGMPE